MLQTDYSTNNSKEVKLWELGIDAVEARTLQANGREEVNKLLSEGWTLIHVYTVKYKDEDVWRERPMAIIGRPRDKFTSNMTSQRTSH